MSHFEIDDRGCRKIVGSAEGKAYEVRLKENREKYSTHFNIPRASWNMGDQGMLFGSVPIVKAEVCDDLDEFPPVEPPSSFKRLMSRPPRPPVIRNVGVLSQRVPGDETCDGGVDTEFTVAAPTFLKPRGPSKANTEELPVIQTAVPRDGDAHERRSFKNLDELRGETCEKASRFDKLLQVLGAETILKSSHGREETPISSFDSDRAGESTPPSSACSFDDDRFRFTSLENLYDKLDERHASRAARSSRACRP